MAGKAFEIKVTDQEVLAALNGLVQRSSNLRPAFMEIGERMRAMIDERFSTETDFEGRRWKPNAPATLLAYMRRKGVGKVQFHKGDGQMPPDAKRHKDGTLKRHGLDKEGRITTQTAQMVANKKVLQGLTGMLRQQNYYRVGDNSLTVGNSQPYAAIQQFGGQAGRGKRVSIPARPFMPINQDGQLSESAKQEVLDILQRNLTL